VQTSSKRTSICWKRRKSLSGKMVLAPAVRSIAIVLVVAIAVAVSVVATDANVVVDDDGFDEAAMTTSTTRTTTDSTGSSAQLTFHDVVPAQLRRSSSTRNLEYNGDDKYHRGDRHLKDGKCDKCPRHEFFVYVEGRNEYHDAFIQRTLNQCVLAALQSVTDIAAAGYAVPPGKVGITQGFFPIDDYYYDCHFDDEKTDNCTVAACHDPFESYFKNFDDSDVPSDRNHWKVPDPLDCGATYVGVGSDLLLRPVKLWNFRNSNFSPNPNPDDDPYQYDGFIYQCCPEEQKVCEYIEPDTD